MKTMNKLLALVLTLALLISVPVAAAAAEENTSRVFSEEIPNSITFDETTGKGLAFLIRTNIRGAAEKANREFDNTNAVVTLDGMDYSVVSMGAVMVNSANVADKDSIGLESVDHKAVLDVPARYLWDVEADSCSFAVRIINLPEKALGVAVSCRPYVVLKDAQGNEFTHYGDSAATTYNMEYYTAAEEIPVWEPSIADVDDKITVSNVSAEYVAYAPTTYREAFKVSLTLTNESVNAYTSEGDTITYVCKDAEGNVLGETVVAVDEMVMEDEKDVEFYAPVGTATIEAANLNLNYIPDVIMPIVGSDIDVTKKKNRIRVSATEASFNEDGTIHVKWTFKNYTSNWITEETDYIKYTYTRANGSKVTKTMYIGVIDTKKNPVKTYEFDVPADTTKVAITSSKIVYWTEWS